MFYQSLYKLFKYELCNVNVTMLMFNVQCLLCFYYSDRPALRAYDYITFRYYDILLLFFDVTLKQRQGDDQIPPPVQSL